MLETPARSTYPCLPYQFVIEILPPRLILDITITFFEIYGLLRIIILLISLISFILTAVFSLFYEQFPKCFIYLYNTNV